MVPELEPPPRRHRSRGRLRGVLRVLGRAHGHLGRRHLCRLWLVLRDADPIAKARFMGQPLSIHVIVIGSGLAIHGGSADGAMPRS